MNKWILKTANVKSSLILFLLFNLFITSVNCQQKTVISLKEINNKSLVDIRIGNIPHEWAIKEQFIADGVGDTGKLPWKGEGWYRKV